MFPSFQRRTFRGIAIAALFVSGACTLQAQADDPRQALAAHRYADALNAADAQLKAHPGDAQLLLVRSLSLAGLGRTGPALASFDRTLLAAHDAVPILEAAAQVAYGARDKRAGQYLNRLLTADPDNQTAHAMAGVLAYERDDCPAANAHFAHAGEALKGNQPAEEQYGKCLLAVGETAAATALFERLAAEHPNAPGLDYDRAVAYVEGGRFSDAVAVLEPLRGAPHTLNLLGAAYKGSGRLEDAIAALREAAQADPHDERNYIDLATISIEHQSPEAALSVLNAGIAQNPISAALYTLRGAVRAQLAQNDAATEDFEQADRLQPSKLYGAVGLGVLLRDISKLPEAERLVRARLREHPSDATLNYLLGDVLIREGAAPGEPRFEEARKLLERAVALKPDLAVAHGELGKLDLKSGRTDEAIGELEHGVHEDPTDRTSLNQLVAAYRRAGRTEDAARVAADLGKAVERDRREETERNRVHLTAVAQGGSE